MSSPVFVFQKSPGLTIRLVRVSKRLRQSDLAAIAGVTQADVSQIERDRKIVQTRQHRILEALGIDPEAFNAAP